MYALTIRIFQLQAIVLSRELHKPITAYQQHLYFLNLFCLINLTFITVLYSHEITIGAAMICSVGWSCLHQSWKREMGAQILHPSLLLDIDNCSIIKVFVIWYLIKKNQFLIFFILYSLYFSTNETAEKLNSLFIALHYTCSVFAWYSCFYPNLLITGIIMRNNEWLVFQSLLTSSIHLLLWYDQYAIIMFQPLLFTDFPQEYEGCCFWHLPH
jgi:hypothetical protein